MANLDFKALRENKNLSQVDVAKLLGVHINTYINWERGCGNPSPENLKKLEGLYRFNSESDGE